MDAMLFDIAEVQLLANGFHQSEDTHNFCIYVTFITIITFITFF